jgi:hypothetical protein
VESQRRPAFRPRVSVVVPTWNRADLLREALGSLVSQSLGEIEILVSDNGSTDHTADVVASIEDPRIAYLPLPENIGLHGNLNRCLSLGSAPYLAYLHDDDLYRPENLAQKVAFLDRHPEVGAVHSPVDRIDLTGHVVATNVVFGGTIPPLVEPGAEFIQRSLRSMGLTEFSSTVLRRESIGRARFDPDDGLICDVGFRLRMALTSDVGFIPTPLTMQRKHVGSLTTGGLIQETSSELETIASIAHIDRLWLVKRRFLEEAGHELDDPRGLRRAARTATRQQLARAVDTSTGGDRHPRDVAAALQEAARVDPRVLLTGRAMKVVASSLVGRSLRESVRKARASSRSTGT